MVKYMQEGDTGYSRQTRIRSWKPTTTRLIMDSEGPND